MGDAGYQYQKVVGVARRGGNGEGRKSPIGLELKVENLKMGGAL